MNQFLEDLVLFLIFFLFPLFLLTIAFFPLFIFLLVICIVFQAFIVFSSNFPFLDQTFFQIILGIEYNFKFLAELLLFFPFPNSISHTEVIQVIFIFLSIVKSYLERTFVIDRVVFFRNHD